MVAASGSGCGQQQGLSFAVGFGGGCGNGCGWWWLVAVGWVGLGFVVVSVCFTVGFDGFQCVLQWVSVGSGSELGF